MKKRALLLCAVILLLLCFSSCNTQGSGEATTSASLTTTTSPAAVPPAPERPKSAAWLELEAFIADYLEADAFNLTNIQIGQNCNCIDQHNMLFIFGEKTVDGVVQRVTVLRGLTQDITHHIFQYRDNYSVSEELAENTWLAELVRACILYGEGVPIYHENFYQ